MAKEDFSSISVRKTTKNDLAEIRDRSSIINSHEELMQAFIIILRYCLEKNIKLPIKLWVNGGEL